MLYRKIERDNLGRVNPKYHPRRQETSLQTFLGSLRGVDPRELEKDLEGSLLSQETKTPEIREDDESFGESKPNYDLDPEQGYR